jgi:hypothetical protein
MLRFFGRRRVDRMDGIDRLGHAVRAGQAVEDRVLLSILLVNLLLISLLLVGG